MLKNRLCYLLIFLCTGLFFVCFNGYYSMYVFLLMLALPAFSLLISLPGMLSLRVTVSVPGDSQPARPAKNQPVPLHVAAVNRSFLPAGRARAVLTIGNGFTGESRVERLEFSPARRPQILEHKLSSATCGLIRCRLSKARAYDLLGLFWLPVRLREDGGCQVIVQPTVHGPALGLDPQRALRGEGERYSPTRPGDDPTELFGLRDYRPGDKLNRIDWKLSQKTGSPLVREASRPLTDQALLLADLSGDGIEADTLMDALATLAHFLIGQEVGFLMGFSRGAVPELLEVSQPEALSPALEAVLCQGGRQPLPAKTPFSCPAGVSRVVYLSTRPDPALLGGLYQRYPAARIHLISLLPLASPSLLSLDTLCTRIRPGRLSRDLDGLLL